MKTTSKKRNRTGRRSAKNFGISEMAAALRPLSDADLESGTARWGAYDRARLFHPSRLLVHSPQDDAAVDMEKARRAAQAEGYSREEREADARRWAKDDEEDAEDGWEDRRRRIRDAFADR